MANHNNIWIVVILSLYLSSIFGLEDCFVEHSSGGCDDNCIESCVSSQRDTCKQNWDRTCVMIGLGNCIPVCISASAEEIKERRVTGVSSGTFSSSVVDSTTADYTSGVSSSSTASSMTTSAALTTAQAVSMVTSGRGSAFVTSAPITSSPLTSGSSSSASSSSSSSSSSSGSTTTDSATTGDTGGILDAGDGGSTNGEAKPISTSSNLGLIAGLIAATGLGVSAAFLGGAVVRRKRAKEQQRSGEEQGSELEAQSNEPVARSAPTSSVPKAETPYSDMNRGTMSPTSDYSKISNENKGVYSGELRESVNKLEKRAVSLEIDYNELEIKSKLGEGAFGAVYMAYWRGSAVAVKQLNKSFVREEDNMEFQREIAVMKNLRPHRNVLTLFGYCHDPLCIVTEYCADGTLKDLLNKKGQPMTEQITFNIVRGIAAGMTHLHFEGLVHRDLAARNILLHQNDVKVADFGMSRLVQNPEDETKTNATVGPLRWMSPNLSMIEFIPIKPMFGVSDVLFLKY